MAIFLGQRRAAQVERPAGRDFGLGLREMAAGGRMEDVSARKWREAGPGTPLFPCWARWAETAEGSHPYPVRPRPEEALPAQGWPGTRGSGTRHLGGQWGPRRSGSRLTFPSGGRVGCWAGDARMLGVPGRRPAHVRRASLIPELGASRDALLA